MKQCTDFREHLTEKYLNVEFVGLDSFERNRNNLKAKLFEDLISGDESRVLGAAKIVVDLDNLCFTKDQLDKIKITFSTLQESDICVMYDYRLDIKEAIAVIENFIVGNNCKCKLYPDSTKFFPKREIEMGLVDIIGERFVNQQEYQMEYSVQCKICKTNWFVIEQHSYHYPWTKWTKK
jgi:hypothetical protein